MAKSNLRLKFPVLNNVEYLDVIKSKQVVKTFRGSELEGVTWRELQTKLGNELAVTLYNYSLKFNDNAQIYNGTIRAVKPNQVIQTESNETDFIKRELVNIKNSINQAGNSGGVSVDLLLSISKQSYETQINFLNIEINRRELLISESKNKIDELENELDICYETIDDLKSKTGIGQYLEMAQTFLTAKAGNLKPITNLQDSNVSDIPTEILNLLGAVNWTEVEPNVLQTIIHYLSIYLQKLPLKGKDNV